MTLVEVLAGALLLGGLLTSIVLANARLTGQSRRAALRHQAVGIADELLTQWWYQKAEQFPRAGSGEVPGRGGWKWQTTPVENAGAQALGGEVVALEVLAPDNGIVAVRVEVALPPSARDKQ